MPKPERTVETITLYALCRPDGSDYRMCPEGTTLEDAKGGRDLLNREAITGRSTPTTAYPHGEELGANSASEVRHNGEPVQYEVRILSQEIS